MTSLDLGPTSRTWLAEIACEGQPILSDRQPRRLSGRQKFAAEKYSTVDSVLSLMDGLHFKADGPEYAGVHIPASGFSGTWVHIDELAELHDNSLVYAGGDVFDLWPINARFGSRDGLNAVESISPRNARGKVTRVMPRMIRHARAWIDKGIAHTSANYYGVRLDNTLVNLTNSSEYGMVPIVSTATYESICAFVGWQLTAEYLWSVEIRSRGSNFAIRIPTYPEGALRLLSLRDIEPGAARRTALRHWVREHSRQVRRSDGEVDRVSVRSHLRGATPFSWEDFEGVVRPSAFDLRRCTEVTP